MPRYYVSRTGFVISTASGPQLIERGVYEAPLGFVPLPDSDLLKPMDTAAQSALAASIAAQISLTGPVKPPGIGELNPHPPIFAR